MALVAGTAHAEPTQMEEVERLYLAGQEHYEAQDFEAAARAWVELLEVLPESKENRAIRENVVVNVLYAYGDAFERMRADDGTRRTELAEAALAVAAEYVEELKAAFGEDAVVAAAITEKTEEIAAALERYNNPPGDERIESCLQPCLEPPCLAPCLQPCLDIERRGCGAGRDNFVKSAFVFLAALGVRRRRRRDVLDDVAERLPTDVVTRLRKRGDD